MTVAGRSARRTSPHLVGFYTRYFKEQGRFPVLERVLD